MTKLMLILVFTACAAQAGVLRFVNATSGVCSVTLAGANDWVAAGEVRTYEMVPAGVCTVTAVASDGSTASGMYTLDPLGRYSLCFMPAAGGVTLNLSEDSLSADYFAVFMKGFTVGMVWELFGLLIRIVRKTATQTTGI